jgi:hypothetical protein
MHADYSVLADVAPQVLYLLADFLLSSSSISDKEVLKLPTVIMDLFCFR